MGFLGHGAMCDELWNYYLTFTIKGADHFFKNLVMLHNG